MNHERATSFDDEKIEDFYYEKAVGVDDFDIISLLGEGSYGKVLMVRKKDTGLLYAMKVHRKGPELDSEVVMREKNVLIKMKHPYMVQLHYAFENTKNLYMVMTYVEGGDFLKLMRTVSNRRLTEDHVKFYIAQLFLAIEALHSNNVLYRDLKLENILMTSEGHVALADFGLSKYVEPSKILPTIQNQNGGGSASGSQGSQTLTNPGMKKRHSIAGTPEYMAPEVLKGQHYGAEVDYWSLGVVTYAMLTGKIPFRPRNNDISTLLDDIFAGRFHMPEDLSAAAQSFLRGCLEVNIDRRLGKDPVQFRNHPFFAGIDWERLASKEIRPPHVPPPPLDHDARHVFLGGSCDPTTWRMDVAIPMLDKVGISFYNPQVQDWHEGLITVEAIQKTKAQTLLFVIDNQTRAIASMLEAAEYIGFKRHVVLVIQDIQEHSVIEGDRMVGRELEDMNRGRAFLRALAARNQVVQFSDVPQAIEYIIKFHQGKKVRNQRAH